MNNLGSFEEYIIKKSDKIKISSVEINNGDVFLALQGKKYHGNKFILSSLSKGAKFCITDNKNYLPNKKVIYVNNIFEYLSSLAIKKRKLYKGKLVGITGSAGKTTLKETLAFFLKKNHTISYSKKSYNNKLGVLVSLLNLNLKSEYAIFEMGTNNFGEIKNLTKILTPQEIFITNIQSTHLENFKSKKNIAKEKSDIFNSKFNKQRKKIYLNITNQSEKIILEKACNEKLLKIINIDGKNKYFIKDILKVNNYYEIYFSINKKLIIIKVNLIIMFRIINLLFCYAFFNENDLNLNDISKRYKYLKPVVGRGLINQIKLNKKKIRIIDESYNANPDTMIQSINYYNEIKINFNRKILILGNMNELGKNAEKMHLKLLNFVNKFNFKMIILCGEFFRRPIKKIINPKNEFIYLNNSIEIMNHLIKKTHNDDIILVKCSNTTEVNKFANELLKKKVI